MIKKYNYPHSITNKFGETLHFLSREIDEKGEYLKVSNKVSPENHEQHIINYTGSIILNSVNSPSLLSTEIVPRCAFIIS